LERERERQRDGILPGDLTFKAMAAIFDGNTALTDHYSVHQFPHLYYPASWKETSCAISKIQPENLCFPAGHTTVKEHVYKGMFKVDLE